MIAVLLPFLLAKPKVAAWVVGYNPASIQRFAERADQFDTIYMEAYGVTADGLAFRREQYGETIKKARDIAKKHHVGFFTMASNYAEGQGDDGFDPKRMTKALASAESRAALAESLVKVASEDGAEGVDLDFESLKADDRDRYSAFAVALAKKLHSKGLKLSITVHPKDSVDGNWDGVKAHDYKALGAAADRINVMTYDFSWSTGPEGAIAPNNWVERVMTFAKSQVDPAKLALGIACYGYDWSKKPAESVGWDDLKDKPSQVDASSGELVRGKLHFSASEAFRQKYLMAERLGIGSVAFWYCGSEDPKTWSFLPKRR